MSITPILAFKFTMDWDKGLIPKPFYLKDFKFYSGNGYALQPDPLSSGGYRWGFKNESIHNPAVDPIDVGSGLVYGIAAALERVAAKTGGQLLLGVGKFPRLDYKFGRHAADWSQWGSISKTAYYKRAVSLAGSPVDSKILGFTAKQGWSFRFNSATGEFLTTHPTGYIETFFRPSKGMDYYLKQVKLYGQ